MTTVSEVFEGLKAVHARAKQWKADGHTGEGPDGHLLRDIRGTVQHYIDDLNEDIVVGS